MLEWWRLLPKPASRKRIVKTERRDPEAELCRVLMKTSAMKFGLFKLSSGKLSPYYIDLRMVPGDPKGLRTVIEMYERLVKSDVGISTFDRVAGVPTAGVPYASILAYRLAKPFLYVRRELKTHGSERRVEGQLLPGDRVVVMDDLVTTGKNTLQAAEAIRAEGGQVEHAVVLIDRQEGGGIALANVGVKLHAFTTISRMARRLLDTGVIEDDQYEDILAQIST
jgi:orotate phosphoribosyltransferase